MKQVSQFGWTLLLAALAVGPVETNGQGILSVTPGDGFHAERLPGGSFIPDGKTYLLQNTGASSIGWTLSHTSAAFVVSKDAGTLSPGQIDAVTVSVNTNYPFTPGVNCADTILFINITNTQGNTSRAVDAVVRFAITGVSMLSSNQVVLQWAGVTQGWHAVEYCTDLLAPVWTQVPPTSQWWTTSTVWTNTAVQSHRQFFRVKAMGQ